MSRFLPARSRLLGPNGQPISQFLYPSPRQNPGLYRPRPTLSRSTQDNVNEYDRAELVDYSRQLFAQIPELETAIVQKNSWAFGDSWESHYLGRNEKWGEEAAEWLKWQFYPSLNLRGPLFDFRRTMLLSGMALDYDGDDAALLTEAENHFPQIAIFPTTRIGTGDVGRAQRDEVRGGAFSGSRIYQGVITSREGRMVGLRILGENGEKARDFSTYSADLMFEAIWSDQCRGIPRPSSGLTRWLNREDIDHFMQHGMKRAAAMQLKVKTASGEVLEGNETVTGEQNVPDLAGNPETRTIYAEQIGQGGDLYYYSTSDGEELEVLDYKNPHPNSEAFIERITRGCLASVGWFYELLNLGDTSRAPTRLVCDLANQTIWARQEAMWRRMTRIRNYGLAKAMKHGFISRNDDGNDPYLWEFGLPKQLSVDAGNDEQAAREAVKMGMSSKQIEAAKKGYRALDIEKQRMAELRRLCDNALALSKEYGIPFDSARELIEQRSPNPVMQQAQKQLPQQTQSSK